MINFREHPSTTENEATRRFSDIPNTFKRTLVNDGRMLCPRRYVMAFMLFVLLFIQVWRSTNVLFTLAHAILGDAEYQFRYSSIKDWTLQELDNFRLWSTVAEVLAQMPGALLIFTYSSHKYLLVSVPITSILHMLTPITLSHHSASLLVVLVSQSVIAAPIYIAVISIWKDWAPPAERTKLMIFSFYSIFLGTAATTFYSLFFLYIISDASYYLSGLAGIIWALFWYNITSDTPRNDPLISEDELLYMENSIPTDIQHKIKITDVPWKSIITSMPVFLLCIIYFKMAVPIETISISGIIFTFHMREENPLYYFIGLLSLFVVILPGSAILADYLIKTFSGRTLLIRQIFLCGGFGVHIVCMFGTLTNSIIVKTVFFIMSYCFFAISVPGFITIALDLSPRYVTIISGFILTFYYLGYLGIMYFIEFTVALLRVQTISWLFLFDGILSLVAGILFLIWGDVNEQLWSLTFISSPIRANDYQSYPRPEDEDNLNLVSENV